MTETMTKEMLKRANICMRRDSNKARCAQMALTIGLAMRDTAGGAVDFAKDFIGGDKVTLEYLQAGIDMATWSDVRLRARLATIRANSRY